MNKEFEKFIEQTEKTNDKASEKYVSGAEKNLTNFVMDTLQMTRKWKIIVKTYTDKPRIIRTIIITAVLS
jgi:hypothetical protein